MSRPRRIASVLLVGGLLAPSAPALADETAPQWEATSDTGSMGDDVARFTGASPTLNMVNQGLDTVFVTGTSSKPAALQAAGINDLDVGTTAYNANTGALRWKATYDRGLGIHDQIAAFEVNFHNNLIYEVVNSGSDIVTIERSVSDGELDSSAAIAGATARDSAISPTGGFLGVVGSQGSKFLAATYMTGIPTLIMQATPTDGRANSADISHTGALDTTRTMLVTGQSSGFGTRGDLYTVAYDYQAVRDPSLPARKLWERSWASPNSAAEEGMVAEAAHVSALGKGVGFVAGRTFTSGNWDIFVAAYDLKTGAPLWSGDGLRYFDGTSSRTDEPVALAYSDKNSTLYLTGRSERGANFDQDVVTIAYDALTGQQKAVAYASGNSTHGNDSPTGLLLSKDQQRLFVAADVQNLLGDGGRQAALFGYDSQLRSIGTRLMGRPSDDRSAGVAMNVAQDRAFLAGSTRTNSGYDHRVASYSVGGFELFPPDPTEIVTELSFTAASATSGQYSDGATLEVRLADDTGAGLANRSVTIALAGNETSVTTAADGTARATFTLGADPGEYTATASFAGDHPYLPDEAASGFTIEKEESALTLKAVGSGKKRTLEARLFDSDTETSGIGGRDIVFFADGAQIGTGRTSNDGVAKLSVPAGYRGGAHSFRAVFNGDTWFTGTEAQAQTTG